MFRDFKEWGGIKLEGTNVTGERLVVMVFYWLLSLYNCHNAGKKIKLMGYKNISVAERGIRNERRHSGFYIGLYGQTWPNCRATQTVAGVNDTQSQYYQALRASGAYPVWHEALSPASHRPKKRNPTLGVLTTVSPATFWIYSWYFMVTLLSSRLLCKPLNYLSLMHTPISNCNEEKHL